MSQPKQILQLQMIDTELDQAQARLAEIDALLNDNEVLRSAKQKTETTESAYLEAQRELKRAEQEVGAQEGKIANNQRILYSGTVTNPKELEDLQQEAAALKRHLNALEDTQLEIMVGFEEAETANEAANELLKNTKNKVATENSMLGAEFQNLTNRVDTLSGERPEIAAEIEATHMATYNSLREKRAGLAAVRITGEDCPACGNILTAVQAQNARSPNSVTQCDTCGRILVAG